jgi:cellobiose PTS system EIIC component
MQKFINWLNTSVTPKLDKFIQNPWVKGLQRTMLSTVGIIMFASIIQIYNTVAELTTFLPVLGNLYNFTFFLLALYEAIVIPYHVLDGLRLKRLQVSTMMLSVCAFIICQGWDLQLYGTTGISFKLLGPQGIVLAIVVSYYVTWIMYMFRNFSFFKEDSVLPSFVTKWFNEMLPMAFCLVVPYVLVYNLGFNLIQFIIDVFSPIEAIANTFPGFLLLCFSYTFFYSIGASGWIFSGAFYPILMNTIASNAEIVASGGVALGVATNEVIFRSGWVALGGLGATLSLNILMLKSKSKRLSGVAKGALVPSLCNINEPIVYGAPIVMNPLLMIPMWINAIVLPAIVWIAVHTGILGAPSVAFNLGYIPAVISAAFLYNGSYFLNILFIAIALVVSGIIYYPFFKAFEKQEIAKEEAANGEVSE